MASGRLRGEQAVCSSARRAKLLCLFVRCGETLKRGEANQNIFFFRGGGVISKIIFLRLLPNVHEQHQTLKKLGQLDPERGRTRARRAIDGAVSTPDLSFLSPHERSKKKKKKSGGVSGRERKLRALKNKKPHQTQERDLISISNEEREGTRDGRDERERDNEREMQREEWSRQQSDGGK